MCFIYIDSEILGEIFVMPKDDYSDVLENIFSKVKDRKEGVLYTCIKELDSDNASEISEYFKISPENSLGDDLQLLRHIPSFQPILARMDWLAAIKDIPLLRGLVEMTTMGIHSFLNRNFLIGVVLFAALVILGFWSLMGRNNKSGGRGSRRRDNERASSHDVGDSSPASLCLVIPCNHIEPSLQKCLSERNIRSRQTADLIDESVYFLVTEPAKSYSPTIQLNDSWKDFPDGSDLFIQLHIPDRNDLTDVDLKWSLSRAVSAKDQFIEIKEIGLRQDFNNLEKFHRA